jgi:activator of HSP90 ATPase
VGTISDPDKYRTRRQLLAGLSIGAGVAAVRSLELLAADSTSEISRTMEAIHQTVIFKASRKRVYAALTDAGQFHRVTLLSAAAKSGMAKMTTPTQISREPGGPFTVFGGLIVGRQIELVPEERIVQAWRPADWQPGLYSVVRFDLHEQGGETHLGFNHTGFPQGQAEHLAQGWQMNYWEPLEKFLA